MTKSAPALLLFFCFQTVFPQAVHSLMEREVRRQVKPTPAHLPAVMLPKSGKGPRDQQGLAPSDFYGCGTIPLFPAQIDAYFWLLVFIACP